MRRGEVVWGGEVVATLEASTRVAHSHSHLAAGATRDRLLDWAGPREGGQSGQRADRAWPDVSYTGGGSNIEGPNAARGQLHALRASFTIPHPRNKSSHHKGRRFSSPALSHQGSSFAIAAQDGHQARSLVVADCIVSGKSKSCQARGQGRLDANSMALRSSPAARGLAHLASSSSGHGCSYYLSASPSPLSRLEPLNVG